MGQGKNRQVYTEEYFTNLGYTKNKDGSFSPPKFKNPLTHLTKDKIDYKRKSLELVDLVQKEKVIETSDFEVRPVTEWIIRGNVPSKKNSRQNFVRNGRIVSIPSKLHSEYVKSTAMQYKVFGIEFKRSVEVLKLPYPIYMEFTFIRGSKHRWDYSNAVQTVEDIIVENSWIPDDSADYLIPVFKPYEYDKNNPGVKIKLLCK